MLRARLLCARLFGTPRRFNSRLLDSRLLRAGLLTRSLDARL
jgi:hypothetical protein